MHLFKLFLTVGLIAAVTLFVLVIAGYVGYNIYHTTRNVTENVVHQYNKSVNVSDYDVVAKTMWIWGIIDITLILAFIFMVVAVFMHSRKR